MTFSEADLHTLVELHLEAEIDNGYPIKSINGWKRARRDQLLENERLMPGFIERSCHAMTAKKDGKRVTRCKEVRGSHGTTYIYDLRGTDEPPAWWNEDAAKAEEERRT